MSLFIDPLYYAGLKLKALRSALTRADNNTPVHVTDDDYRAAIREFFADVDPAMDDAVVETALQDFKGFLSVEAQLRHSCDRLVQALVA